jgi:NAD(P)-dependent dehydrogenase (short-subunit alcohol dehydrogenase family)
LITGTSSGIGLSAAIECAAAGYSVVATMRNLGKRSALEQAAEARGVKLDIEQLDVISPASTAKIRELVLKYGPFYGLVNNAGIAVGGAFEEQSDANIREQFETNVFGLMATTRALLPCMRAAGRGRIVNVSSLSGRVAFPGVSIYAATKHAVEGFSESLRWEVEPFGIGVCLVEPGTFKTPIFFANQRRTEAPVKSGPYASMTEKLEKLILASADKAPEPDLVGKTIARLLAQASPPLRTALGVDARTLVALRRVMPDALFDTGVRRIIGLRRPR